MRSFVATLLRMVNRFRAAVLATDKGGNSPDGRKIARGESKKEMRARKKNEEENLRQDGEVRGDEDCNWAGWREAAS